MIEKYFSNEETWQNPQKWENRSKIIEKLFSNEKTPDKIRKNQKTLAKA